MKSNFLSLNTFSFCHRKRKTDSGLPLLQFALTELWEARKGDVITEDSLAKIGGVTGALARHADQVLMSLPADQRAAARRILMMLVTLEGTRARRTQEEILINPAAHAAAEALVKGRLIVARDTGEALAYEVAHEALIRGWDTLKRWLKELEDHGLFRQSSNEKLGENHEPYLIAVLHKEGVRHRVKIVLENPLAQRVDRKVIEMVKPVDK